MDPLLPRPAISSSSMASFAWPRSTHRGQEFRRRNGAALRFSIGTARSRFPLPHVATGPQPSAAKRHLNNAGGGEYEDDREDRCGKDRLAEEGGTDDDGDHGRPGSCWYSWITL